MRHQARDAPLFTGEAPHVRLEQAVVSQARAGVPEWLQLAIRYTHEHVLQRKPQQTLARMRMVGHLPLVRLSVVGVQEPV
jgi:hypothetical protein